MEVVDENKPETYQYKDTEYDNTDGVSMQQDGGVSGYRDKVTTYNYKGKRIPVPIRWHPNAVIRRIVEHNKRSQYTIAKSRDAIFGSCWKDFGVCTTLSS